MQRDALGKGRKLTPEQVAWVREMRWRGATYAQLSAAVPSVHWRTLQRAVNGRTYAFAKKPVPAGPRIPHNKVLKMPEFSRSVTLAREIPRRSSGEVRRREATKRRAVSAELQAVMRVPLNEPLSDQERADILLRVLRTKKEVTFGQNRS